MLQFRLHPTEQLQGHCRSYISLFGRLPIKVLENILDRCIGSGQNIVAVPQVCINHCDIALYGSCSRLRRGDLQTRQKSRSTLML
jgi:hypothetical protein